LIAPETIALVRERTDIVALVTENVPSLKRRGRSFVGLCPFHKEKSPSFHVNPDRGFFHCFGCKESGSAVDFLMKIEGLTFPEAMRDLAERAGIPIQEDFRERTEVDRQKKHKDDLYAVSHLAATFFEQQLRDHPHRASPLAELARRGLTPTWGRDPEGRGPDRSGGSTETSEGPSAIDDALQAFRIGYAPPAWDGLSTFLRAQGVSPMAAEQVGLLVPRSSGSGHYDRFRHRLMFAVVDPQGRVIAFSGRALAPLPGDEGDKGDKSDKPAKYINSPESPIYSKGQSLFGIYQARHALREEQVAVVVEGNFDVVSLHARGMKNVVAPLGTAFTADQAKLLKRFVTQVVLLFDGDAAGRKAVTASRAPLKDAGLPSKVANLPAGADPDDVARAKGVDALREIVGRARGMLEFLIGDLLDTTFNQADAYERAARVGEVGKLLAGENDPLVRSLAKSYADELASRLDMHGLRRSRDDTSTPEGFRALEQAVKRALATTSDAPALRPGESGEPPRRARVPPRPLGAEHRRAIVGALVEYPDLLHDPEVAPFLELMEGDSAIAVAALAKWRTPAAGEALDPQRLLGELSGPVQAFAARRLAAPTLETKDAAKGELLLNGERLRRLMTTRDMADLVQQQHDAEGDWEAMAALGREATERGRARAGGKA